MGRLFIIGNGFDCAHGNHTAYRYFRDWMLEQLREMGVSEEQMEELPEIPFAGMGNHELEYEYLRKCLIVKAFLNTQCSKAMSDRMKIAIRNAAAF